MATIKILGISGSLKSTSSNTNILKAIAGLTSPQVKMTIYDEMAELPHFNPDNEIGNQAVSKFRELLKEADAVVICTPEYAFGVPGALKNALDWTVSSGELNEKPVLAISASPLYEGGSKALSSLLLTLGALGTKMGEQSSLSIANVYKKMSSEGKLHDEVTIENLKAGLEFLISATSK